MAAGSLVLVIDEGGTFRDELAARLVAAGYRTITAASGTEGMRAAASQRPDAIIVDGATPDRNGALVIRRLRLDPALRATPCLLLTGSDTADAEIEALDAGADAFARKASTVDVILARFAAMLLRTSDVQRDSGAATSRRILAIDDNATYRFTIAVQLQEDGFDVIEAGSGEEAIDLLALQPVDCILLDLNMPGLGGIETCRRIKAAPAVRDTPLIALTGQDDRETMIEALSAGADDFVSKLSTTDVLVARVNTQIRRKRVADEYRQLRERLLRSEAARELAETRAALAERLAHANAELAATNRELESFSSSVSHDLRTPLRAIIGFSGALLEDHAPAMDAEARGYIDRIVTNAWRMSELIDDLLVLAKVSRAELMRERVDVSALAMSVIRQLRSTDRDRELDTIVHPDMTADGDARLVRIAFENLIGNAWKFTSRTSSARIEVGARELDGETIFFVRDNGAGFDMAFAQRLFVAFVRLHNESEFPGTGIGLATVHRIVTRHGGRIWVTARPGEGATFELTLAPR